MTTFELARQVERLERQFAALNGQLQAGDTAMAIHFQQTMLALRELRDEVEQLRKTLSVRRLA